MHLAKKNLLAGSLAAKILSVRVLIGAINRILAYQICIPYKKERDVLVSTIAGAVFNLIANILLIPLWGTTGASIATLCSEVVVFIVLAMRSKKFFDTKKLNDKLPKYLLASVWFFVIRYIVDILVKSIMSKLLLTVFVALLAIFLF